MKNSFEQEVNFNQEELTRYSRHFTLSEIGLAGQTKLKTARVLCVGAGGLGSPLLLYLAAAGVGTLGIVDNDSVDLSNLQRQILYSCDELKTKKAYAAKATLQKLNPHVNVVAHDIQLTRDNALSVIEQYDLIADTTDNFATRYLINDACFHLKKPNVYASIFQFEGQCSVFNSDNGPCYRCLYDSPPPAGLIPNCAEGGVLGVLPGIMGAIQANEIIKLIIGIGSPLVGRLLTFNALAMNFQEFALIKNPNCSLCHHNQPFVFLPEHEMETCRHLTEKTDDLETVTAKDLNKLIRSQSDFILIDVREPYEYAICNLGGRLIPLNELPNKLKELDKSKPIIVYCKAGIRSQHAVKLLREAGFSAKHLTGGILAWANEIDPSLPQY